MENKVMEMEVNQVIESIGKFSANYAPKILYCLVNRMESHRICEKENGNGYINPAPGTVIDTGLVEK